LIISCLLFIDINTTLLYQAAIKQATVMIAAVACHSAETTIEEIPQRLGLDDAKSGGWIIDRLRACVHQHLGWLALISHAHNLCGFFWKPSHSTNNAYFEEGRIVYNENDNEM
jgi:hypothetical protein